MTTFQTYSNDPFTKEVILFFNDHPVFGPITADEVAVMASHMKKIELAAGQTLFSESDPGRYVGFVTKGILEVFRRHPEKEKMILLTELRTGDITGEMAIINNAPRSATIKATSDTSLFILSQSAFDLLLQKHPHIGIKLLKGISTCLSNHLRDTTTKLIMASSAEQTSPKTTP